MIKVDFSELKVCQKKKKNCSFNIKQILKPTLMQSHLFSHVPYVMSYYVDFKLVSYLLPFRQYARQTLRHNV